MVSEKILEVWKRNGKTKRWIELSIKMFEAEKEGKQDLANQFLSERNALDSQREQSRIYKQRKKAEFPHFVGMRINDSLFKSINNYADRMECYGRDKRSKAIRFILNNFFEKYEKGDINELMEEN